MCPGNSGIKVNGINLKITDIVYLMSQLASWEAELLKIKFYYLSDIIMVIQFKFKYFKNGIDICLFTEQTGTINTCTLKYITHGGFYIYINLGILSLCTEP